MPPSTPYLPLPAPATFSIFAAANVTRLLTVLTTDVAVNCTRDGVYRDDTARATRRSYNNNDHYIPSLLRTSLYCDISTYGRTQCARLTDVCLPVHNVANGSTATRVPSHLLELPSCRTSTATARGRILPSYHRNTSLVPYGHRAHMRQA